MHNFLVKLNNNFLVKLNRSQKKFIMVASDALLLPLALWSAIALRLGEWLRRIAGLCWLVSLAPLLAIPVFAKLGLYRAVTRYMEDKVAVTVLQGVSLSVILLVAALTLLDLQE